MSSLHPHTELKIEHDVPISTWFHIGGHADRLAYPQSIDELGECLEIDDELKVLGEGANLLVHDRGVRHMVVSMQSEGLSQIEIDSTAGVVKVGAGVSLPRLINRCVREGLGGLETLAGIPATIGGAIIMNAGGAFGEIADSVLEVHALDRAGRTHVFQRDQIDFGYRRSSLNHVLVTGAVLKLEHGDIDTLKAARDRYMKYKAESQPLSAKSAGCVFKNPTLHDSVDGIGETGERCSAGLIIDRAGCKGMEFSGAQVSQVHANFITTTPDTKASAVIELIGRVHRVVHDTYGIDLQKELVIWGDES